MPVPALSTSSSDGFPLNIIDVECSPRVPSGEYVRSYAGASSQPDGSRYMKLKFLEWSSLLMDTISKTLQQATTCRTRIRIYPLSCVICLRLRHDIKQRLQLYLSFASLPPFPVFVILYIFQFIDGSILWFVHHVYQFIKIVQSTNNLYKRF